MIVQRNGGCGTRDDDYLLGNYKRKYGSDKIFILIYDILNYIYKEGKENERQIEFS